VIAPGPGIAHTTPAIKPRLVDVHATVLSRFGVSPVADGDGQPVGTASTDPFDAQVGALQTRVDETGIPSDVKGWTRSFPSGWTVDNTGLGSGGVTEWRGWTLSNDDFWSRTQAGQQRENNVRARGVFAVADSDEWADKAYTGTYNIRMSAPSYSVAGARTATISFASHYLKEGSETATVSVSFDGGTATKLLTYDGDAVATPEKLSVQVPSGASTMRVTWSLTNGNNNWYWAVDNPEVSVS